MEAVGTVLDVFLVILGFGFIIFIHELGHFVAAKWAGIRVLAFAMGMGPAIASYRRGMGLRLGSSARAYDALVRGRVQAGEPLPADVSPTEYRLNWVPLGGYVKMLGQEDDNPAARSDEPDSYQSCKPWKRMIVISAGVIMNLITAAVIFVIVFMVGLKTEPAKVGLVWPGSPAELAGLQPGDRIVAIDGEATESFKDVAVAAAMSRRGRAMAMEIERDGVMKTVSVTPKEDPTTRLQSIGIAPPAAAEFLMPKTASGQAEARAARTRVGLGDIPDGGRLSAVAGLPGPARPYQLDQAAKASSGRPFTVTFALPSGGVKSLEVAPVPLLQPAQFEDKTRAGTLLSAEHLLGLMPMLVVAAAEKEDGGYAAGLRTGDLLVRVGDVQYPTAVEGIAEIRRSAGRKIPVGLLREGKRIDLPEVPVNSRGQIGFAAGTSAGTLAIIGRWPAENRFVLRSEGSPVPAPSGAALGLLPGSRIVAVGGTPTRTLIDVRNALQNLARAAGQGVLTVRLSVTPPSGDAGDPPAIEVDWTLKPDEVKAAAELSWASPIPQDLFELEQMVLKADTPWGAVARGVHETHRAMLQTYLTLARLVQGTMKVEHLKGPVGIAHTGTLLAERGLIWLLFFMGVISVNLAVLNFLPLPIVDGGHFVFLVYEQLTGRPVSPGVQGAATLAGLLLIGTMFVIVTYNDLANLLWR